MCICFLNLLFQTRNAKTTNWTSVCCFKTCLMDWPGFVLFFCVFFDLGVLSPRGEKKNAKKMGRGPRGGGSTGGRAPPPPPAHLRPAPSRPARMQLRVLLAANCQLYLGPFDLLFGPLGFK
jgi:hypothetical protein